MELMFKIVVGLNISLAFIFFIYQTLSNKEDNTGHTNNDK